MIQSVRMVQVVVVAAAVQHVVVACEHMKMQVLSLSTSLILSLGERHVEW